MTALDAPLASADRQVFAEFDIEPADLAYLRSVEETLTPEIQEWVVAQWRAEVEALPWFEALHLAPDQVTALADEMSSFLRRLLTGDRVEELYGEVERMTLVALREGVRSTDIFQASTKLELVLTGVILQLFPSPDQQTVALVTLAKFLKSLLYVVMETYRREAANELEGRNRELASALEYQTATSEVLKVISRSTSDLQPVLDTVTETAGRLCGADSATVFIREGEAYRRVSSSAAKMEPEYWAIRRQQTIVPGRDSVVARAALEGRVVHVVDILADPDYASPEAAASGRRTILGVPLLREGAVLGTIGLSRKRVEPYTERQIELVRTFADQAVIAMENARLLSELQARTRDLEESLEYQTATSDVLNVISRSTADVQPVLDTVIETAARLCAADTAAIWMREGEIYRAVASTQARIAAEPEYWANMRQRTIVPGRNSLTGRVALEGGVVHIEDIRADPDYAVPESAASVRPTQLGVPLLREGAVLGTINLARRRVQPYTDRQIELVRTFADQAVIAIENARLLGELRESLEQQQAIAEVLGVINSSPGDLQPVFDVVLDKALKLCEGAFGYLCLVEEETSRRVAWRNLPAAFVEYFRDHAPSTRPGSQLGRIVAGEAFTHALDLKADDIYRSGSPFRRALVDLGGARTQVLVALRKEDRLLGYIGIYRQEVRAFTDKQIALLQSFAAQAVIAMENARLLGELQARTRDLEELLEYQTATSDVLQVISRSTADVQPVLDTVVETAARLCGSEIAAIAIREGGVYRYVSMSTSAAEPEYWAILRQRRIVPGRDSVTARVALEGGVVHVADIRADPDYASPEALASGRRTQLGVPLLRDSEPIGIIMLSRKRVEPYTERQIELVRTFADQAVIAMENARLLGELQARTDELTRSVGELQALEEVARAVNSSLDLDTVLATVIGRAVLLSQADEGMIYEFDEAEEVFVPKSAFGMSAERVEALRERRIKLGETHLGRSAIERAPVYVADVQQDPAVPHAARTLPGIHAVLAVPLLREDKVVGGLVIRRRSETGFAPTIATLMQTFAAQSVLAIENARLFQELAARGEEARRAHAAAENALADLRRAQDRLIQAEKMASLGQLTAGIAHEIKNPLNFVNNFAGLSVELLDELKETAAPAIAGLAEDERADIDEIVGMLTGNLERIAEHGRRADGIVKSMLEHSRGGSGECREVDLNGLVEEALNLAYHGARAQDQSFNITLERAFAPALAPIELVPQDITRVFLNLFGNGFYAATRRQRGGVAPDFRPTLKVTTHDMGEAVEIRVRDNGAGIPPEIRDKLFQPFFTTKPTGEGTGLGLSISWDIVTQQHGGTIAVDSRLGEFTEFAIRLPRTRRSTTARMTA